MTTKKSFILYTDQLSVLDDLTPEQCAELFMAIKAYHNDTKIKLSPIVKIAFSPFKNQFKRDSKKYGEIVEKRIEAGRKGGYQKQQNLANASKCKQTVANLPDNDTVNVNDTVNDKHKNKPSPNPVNGIPYQKIVDLYHEELPMLARVEKLTDTRKSYIRQRWNQKDIEDLNEWKNYFDYVKQSKFLIGCSTPVNGHKPFRANLEWLTKEANFIKILEGNYHG